MDKGNTFDVIVIGAGLAGLSAASTLLESDITNILVLEAQNEIGGRVRTVRVEKDLVFDYGAQWIHGQDKNPIHELAKRRHLLSNDPSFEGQGPFFTQNGEIIDAVLVDRVSTRVDEALESLDDPGTVKNIDEMFTNLEHKLINQDDSCDQDLLVKGLVRWHRNYHLIDNGCSTLEHLTVQSWNEYEECPGNYCQLVESGFSSLIRVMEAMIPAGVIRCNEPVGKIIWKDNPSNSNILIQLSSGNVLECHHVIVTCSAGYLTRNLKDMFQPQLPQRWLDAFQGIGFGTITKILLVFEKPFWNDHCKGIQLIWTDQNEEDATWHRYLTGFDVLHSSSSAALLGWVGGDGATFLDADAISDETVGDQCVQLLKKFTGFTNITKPCKTIRFHIQ